MNIKRMRGRGNGQFRQGGGGGGGGGTQYRQGGGGGGGGQQPVNRNHVFDSNGPDMRLRGTAQQLFEKYLQLGRDATGGGDRVMAESYFQHAEHYFRILNAMAQAQQQQPQNQGMNQGANHGGVQHPYQQRRWQQDQDGDPQDGNGGIQDSPQDGYGAQHDPRQHDPRQHDPRQQDPRRQEPRAEAQQFERHTPHQPRRSQPSQAGDSVQAGSDRQAAPPNGQLGGDEADHAGSHDSDNEAETLPLPEPRD
jgi:hypothetical protein